MSIEACDTQVDLHRDQIAQEAFCRLTVGQEIVVDEKDHLGLTALDFVENLARRTDVVLTLEIGGDRAEFTRESAPPAVLHERHRQVALALEQIAPWLHAPRLCDSCRIFVARLQLPPSRVFDHFRPTKLGIAEVNAVSVKRRLVRMKCRVHAAEHYSDTTTSVFLRNFVGASGGVDLHGDRDQVGRFVVADLLHPIIEHHALDLTGSEGRQNSEHQRFHPPLIDVDAVQHLAYVGLDKRNPHTGSSSSFQSGDRFQRGGGRMIHQGQAG